MVKCIEDALRLLQELIALLGRGGFHLRKFCDSHPSILEAVPPDCRETEVPIELDSNEGIKTLGLLWHPLSDQFLISKGTCAEKLREPKISPVSKRIISSTVAAIFDPLVQLLLYTKFSCSSCGCTSLIGISTTSRTFETADGHVFASVPGERGMCC